MVVLELAHNAEELALVEWLLPVQVFEGADELVVSRGRF